MRVVIAVASLLGGLTLAFVGHRVYVRLHSSKAAGARVEAPIEIKINPEARVSVSITGPLPPSVPCGTAAVIPIEILNQGFVTSRLEAEIIGDPPSGAILAFNPEPLKGVTEEMRSIHITLARPGPTDLTISFRSHNEIPDLGRRDRIHLLMHCQ
jgi:hypothetical protein